MATKTATIEQTALDLEKQYWDALKKKDGATIARLTADRALVVGAQGIRELKGDDVAEMAKSMQYQLNDYGIEHGDVKFMSINDDVAIVAYRVRSEYGAGDIGQTMDAYDATVWVKRDDDWACALHTETPAASKPPEGKVNGSR